MANRWPSMWNDKELHALSKEAEKALESFDKAIWDPKTHTRRPIVTKATTMGSSTDITYTHHIFTEKQEDEIADYLADMGLSSEDFVSILRKLNAKHTLTKKIP